MSSHLRTVHNIVTFVTSASLSEQSQMTFTAVVRIIVFALTCYLVASEQQNLSKHGDISLVKKTGTSVEKEVSHPKKHKPVNTCLSGKEAKMKKKAKICFTFCCIDSPISALAAPLCSLCVCGVCVRVCVCVQLVHSIGFSM